METKKIIQVFTALYSPSKLSTLTSARRPQCTKLCAKALPYVMFLLTEGKTDESEASGQGGLCYVCVWVRKCVCVSVCAGGDTAYCWVRRRVSFFLRIMHFAARTQVLMGTPGRIMHAVLFYKENKKLVFILSLVSVFVPYTRMPKHGKNKKRDQRVESGSLIISEFHLFSCRG